MNTYDDYNADVVIIPSTDVIGAYEAWQGRSKLATGTAKGMRLIATGAAAGEMSVFSVEDDQYVHGAFYPRDIVPA